MISRTLISAFYQIMHSKAREVQDFINNDLLHIVSEAFGDEAEVYDHLYRFFERYYEDGDFISRRYYTRETSGRAAPFAIPYKGSFPHCGGHRRRTREYQGL